MNKPKVIFFDLDETLVENVIPVQTLFSEMYYQFADKLGNHNRDSFFAALRINATDLWANMFEKPQSPESQFIQCFATTVASLKAVPAADQASLATQMFNRFSEMSADNVQLNDGAQEVLSRLRNQGIVTGIITNGMEQVQMGKIKALDLQRQVDHVIISAQARAHKPHAAVFELALKKAKVEAHQAWHVGDHATNDVAGALRAGLKGVFYNPAGHNVDKAFGELTERPDRLINHLTAVPDLLEGDQLTA